MPWLQKIFKNSREREVLKLLNLRSTRFRQILRNYGRILDRLADAAEKQAGGYILDRQYMVSLVEIVVDLSESIIFDLNVIADNRHFAFYDMLSRFNLELRGMLTPEPASEISANQRSSGKPASGIDSRKLAEAISRASALFRDEGQVACRGVATGTVFNLETAGSPSEFPDGAVMVAASIRPDDELIRFMRKASAIVTDFGEPGGDTAILAREFHIPMIVGIEGASKRLETGSTVTIDADECTVYTGRVQELLDYYQAERPNSDEEPEYKLLRGLRQSMFELSLMKKSDHKFSPQDCKSVRDLVHLASELAGDALVELASNRNFLSAYTEVKAGIPVLLRVIDVGEGLIPAATESDKPDMEKVRCLPLLAFISGLEEVERHKTQNSRAGFRQAAMFATIKEEHANIIISQSDRYDIVDSSIGESRESGHIYCRFADRGEGESPGVRGAVSREILSRLNFAAARSPRASSAWLSGLPPTEMKDRLAILGRLSSFLWEVETRTDEGGSLDAIVEDFMGQYV